MLTDGRRTDAGVTGILLAHLGAFGSGELKRDQEESLLTFVNPSPISHEIRALNNWIQAFR